MQDNSWSPVAVPDHARVQVLCKEWHTDTMYAKNHESCTRCESRSCAKKWLPIRYGGTKTCKFMHLHVIYMKLCIVRKFVKVWVAIINIRAPLHTKTTIQAYSSLIGLSSACVTGLVMQRKFTYALELNIRGKRKNWDIMWRSTFFTITTAKQTCGTTRSVSSTVQTQSWNMISMLSRRLLRSPLSADVSGAVVMVAAALAAVAAAALRIAAHEVWHLAFTFLLVMEFHLSFSSSPLLHGSLCLRCTKHNGEKDGCGAHALCSCCPRIASALLSKRADCCHWDGFLFFALLPG